MPQLILGTCSLGVFFYLFYFFMVNDREKKGMFAQNVLICPWLGMNRFSLSFPFYASESELAGLTTMRNSPCFRTLLMSRVCHSGNSYCRQETGRTRRGERRCFVIIEVGINK